MRMNRRNVLVGLGTIVAGGGAALGTGAFSSVEADRTVEIDVAGDSSALLGLDANGDTAFVTNSEDGGTDAGRLIIDLSEDNFSGSASGVNTEATTTIEPGFTVQNNGSQYVDVEIGDVSSSGITVSFVADGSTEDDGNDIDLGTDIIRVQDGESFDVNIEIDTSGVNDTSSSISDNATIIANEADSTNDPGDPNGFVTST